MKDAKDFIRFTYKKYLRVKMTKTIEITVPDIIYEELKYLKVMGYGSMNELIMSTGIILNITNIYYCAREEEIRKSRND